MWWILIILFAFGGFGNGMFGRNMAPNGLDNANQLILEKLNGMSVEQCGQFARVATVFVTAPLLLPMQCVMRGMPLLPVAAKRT